MDLGTYADGRALTYDGPTGVFSIGGTPVASADVLGYDRAGQIAWRDTDTRVWALQVIASGVQTPASSPPAQQASDSSSKTLAGCLTTLVVVGLVVWALSTCSSTPSTPAAVDNPATAAKVDAAFVAAEVDGLVYDVTATTDGKVTVTLAATKDAISQGQGMTKVYDVASGAANIAMKSDASIKEVIVRDGDMKLIDIYTRQ